MPLEELSQQHDGGDRVGEKHPRDVNGDELGKGGQRPIAEEGDEDRRRHNQSHRDQAAPAHLRSGTTGIGKGRHQNPSRRRFLSITVAILS